METPKITSQFGKNFKNYVNHQFLEKHLDEAKKSLTDFFGLDNFKNKTFLDAGFGSGIFSLSAMELNSRKVHSFDYDEESFHCIKQLRSNLPNASDWSVEKGNILDQDYIKTLGTFDLVYCWGVVHHTGDMWKAIENIINTVAQDGLIYFGIYNEADNLGFYPDGRFGGSKFWKMIKKILYHSPQWVQSLTESLAILTISLIYMMTFSNPIKRLKANESRGMTWRTEIKDWLIGHPYEFCRPEEIIHYMLDRGFELKKIKTNNGLLTNHYVFKKVSNQ